MQWQCRVHYALVVPTRLSVYSCPKSSAHTLAHLMIMNSCT